MALQHHTQVVAEEVKSQLTGMCRKYACFICFGRVTQLHLLLCMYMYVLEPSVLSSGVGIIQNRQTPCRLLCTQVNDQPHEGHDMQIVRKETPSLRNMYRSTGNLQQLYLCGKLCSIPGQYRIICSVAPQEILYQTDALHYELRGRTKGLGGTNSSEFHPDTIKLIFVFHASNSTTVK